MTTGGLVLAAAVVAGNLVAGAPPGFDAAVARWMDGLRAPGLDAVMKSGTHLGSILVLLPAALAFAAVALRRGEAPARAAFLPTAVLGAWALGALAKLLVDRARPELFEPLIALPVDASFPSAHTQQAAAFAFAWAMRPGARPSAAALGGAALFVGFVGASRLYLQVHFLSDVLAGLAIGLVWVFALRRAHPVRGG